MLARCRFVQAAAQDLGLIADGSVDVVTARPVLIYVADKQRAFQEAFRVLRPGGRLSIFEPINRFGFPEPPNRLYGFDVTPVQEPAAKVRAVFERAQAATTMIDFDERDLLAFAEHAGFAELHLRYEAEVTSRSPWPAPSWETALAMSPNPLVPTFGQAIQQALTPTEAARLEAHVRPLVEVEQQTWRGLATTAGTEPPSHAWSRPASAASTRPPPASALTARYKHQRAIEARHRRR